MLKTATRSARAARAHVTRPQHATRRPPAATRVPRLRTPPAPYANSAAAFSMRSTIGTPKGQRLSHAPHPMQSSACAPASAR